jgi:hypothetical protein
MTDFSHNSIQALRADVIFLGFKQNESLNVECFSSLEDAAPKARRSSASIAITIAP